MRAFRIVVAAHGDLADAFLSSARLICGLLDDVHAVALQPEDSPESFAERLEAACATDRPILVLTDLVGGTPHNVALAFTRRHPSAVLISGVNLAVLVEAATSMDALDADAVERLVTLGRQALAEAPAMAASRRP
jgi:mannose/fructose/sorbose-specific phosphotransferase system IIA component